MSKNQEDLPGREKRGRPDKKENTERVWMCNDWGPLLTLMPHREQRNMKNFTAFPLARE
jgi:hypothetical protein